jgi:hypothetical protein
MRKRTEPTIVGALPVNLALILRADDLDTAKTFLVRLEEVLDQLDGLVVVHKDVSVDHFWIQRATKVPPSSRRRS